MKRSPMPVGKGFKPRTVPMGGSKGAAFARIEKKEKAASSKAARGMKARKVPANAAEKVWMASVAELGCIVCRRQGRGFVPCAVHHIVEGNRRVGHMFTIGLCDPGHHQNSPDPEQISRHPNKARFTAAYGSEYELLKITQDILKGGPSKVAPLPGPVKKSMENILSTNMITPQDQAPAIDEAQP